MRRLIAVGLSLMLSAPVWAQTPTTPAAPTCAAMDAAFPAGFTDWNGKTPLATASSADRLPQATLILGKGYEVKLLNTPKVAMPIQPEKPGGSVAHAGLFSFTVETEGAYVVALATPAWIDVLEDGKSLEPTTFGHGPECTSIRKMVVFQLKPGAHALQVSGNADAKLKLMVAKKR